MSFNKLLIENLRFEMNKDIRSGVYGMIQREFAYNSSKIDGNALSKEQVFNLFNSVSLDMLDTSYSIKDMEEINGHFAMFDEMLLTIDSQLSEEIIKKFHKLLKNGVLSNSVIGDYKNRENFIGSVETTHPDKVQDEMKSLISLHNNREKTLESLAVFHVAYQCIHPFQDGNGRTGRMILFRECLVNDITPFIIRNKNKSEYLTCLSRAQKTGDYSSLISYFKSEQKWFYIKVKELLE